MESFTPWSALTGGLMVGVGAMLLLAFNGRIMGASGVLASLLPPWENGAPWWQIAFVVGVLAGAVGAGMVMGGVTVEPVAGWAVTLVSGVLVGFGGRLGSGCTSGHGVCGVGRLSPRSIVSVAVFMTTVFLTVLVTRHVLGG